MAGEVYRRKRRLGDMLLQENDITQEQLDQLSSDSIRAVADLADYKESSGAYMPLTKIYIDGSSELGAIGDYPISVNLELN